MSLDEAYKQYQRELNEELVKSGLDPSRLLIDPVLFEESNGYLSKHVLKMHLKQLRRRWKTITGRSYSQNS